MVSLDVQLYMVSVFIITGIALGVVVDLYRALIRNSKPKGWKNHVYDLFLWLISAVIVAWGLLLGNWGELRIYVLLAILLGILIYSQLASPLVLPLFTAFMRVVSKGYSNASKRLSFLSLNLSQRVLAVKDWPLRVTEILNNLKK